MGNTLVDPSDLTDFPGAPFTLAAIDAAADRVRTEAGWHIAPEVTETIEVDGTSRRELILPTLRIVTVAEVRDITDPDSPVVLTGWRVRKGGMLYRDIGWPCGPDAMLEVDLTHGYDTTPPSLFGLLARVAEEEATGSAAKKESIDDFATEYLVGDDAAEAQGRSWSALDPYRVRAGF